MAGLLILSLVYLAIAVGVSKCKPEGIAAYLGVLLGLGMPPIAGIISGRYFMRLLRARSATFGCLVFASFLMFLIAVLFLIFSKSDSVCSLYTSSQGAVAVMSRLQMRPCGPGKRNSVEGYVLRPGAQMLHAARHGG